MRARHRILTALGTAAVAGAVLAGGAVVWIQRAAAEDRSLARVRVETSLLARLVADAPDRDPQAIAETVARDLEVRVSLISADGTVLGDSAKNERGVAEMENHLQRPEIQSARTGGYGESFRTSASTHVEYYYSATTVPGNGPVKFARIALPSSIIHAARGRDAWFVAGAVLVTMALLTGFIYASVRALGRPLEKLATSVERAAEGELRIEMPDGAGDEAERLAGAVRRMQQTMLEKLAELDSERAVLSSVVSGMKEGLLLLEPDLHVRLANDAVREILDIPFNPTGRRLTEVVRHPSVIEAVESAKAGETGAEESTLEIPSSGKSFELRVSALGESAGPSAILVLMFDITQLETLERVRREFVANVSHELRTPVTSIKASVETLTDDATLERDEVERFLGIIRRNADHMGELIADLTDLSLIETGAIALDLSLIDASEVAREVAERLRPVADELDVSIEVELRDAFPIRADRRRLEQMLINLLDNAVKFNRSAGKVIVRGDDRTSTRTIVVEDTGEGISADCREKVFHRFFQVGTGRSRQHRGTGLGLSIVKHLMRLHGGTVRLESELGEGSRFLLDFPIRAHPADSENPESRKAPFQGTG